jgi:hypothetical protein
MSERSDDLHVLQGQLREKNQLVEALTSQLEKTVNQLDRLRRSGADRPGHGPAESGSGGLPVECLTRVMSALDDWQELRPADHFERIEEQLGRLLELASAAPASVPAAHHPGPVKQGGESRPAALDAKHTPEEYWAAAKAKLMGEDPPAGATPAVSAAAAAHAPPAGRAVGAPEPAADLALPPAPESPQSLPDDADVPACLAGIEARDRHIEYLAARLRAAERQAYFPTNWDALAQAPAELRARLEALETLLQDQLKQAEISHSLERAMLTRERAKLSQIKQSLEAQIRRIGGLPLGGAGGSVSHPPKEKEPAPPAKDDPERRWKRIFSR